MFYTIFASLPLLLLIFYLYKNFTISINLSRLIFGRLDGVVVIFLILAFLAKFPIYVLHLWLPKAHVEAPVAGSIILAGVLLKLGGYGIIRFLPLANELTNILQIILIILSLVGGVFIRLNCLAIIDIKSLVACSSVVHIRTCISALLIINDWGIKSSVIIMIAHGLCSSGLFFLIGIIYERTSSRRISMNKGLLNLIPSIRL